ncbi:hypothetical protein [Thermococcus sp.]|uniref:hypothetical protein n=1 Tax=Thermococcus sp. TaxID=35749 RepID=UPI0026195136|nr:hypothetical protein [Thermococcus sp.]
MVQAIIVGLLAFVLFMLVDYPFSILHFRGVDLVPIPRTEGVFIIGIRRRGKMEPEGSEHRLLVTARSEGN